MKAPWLIVDVSCLAYRAMHTMGDLSYRGVQTGVMFGVFREVCDLRDLFNTNRVAWCFDRGYGKRLELCRSYKHSRHDKELTPEIKEARRAVRNQLYRLRTDYLPRMGFQNILAEDDYEADDMIASACANLPQGEEAVIVSSDGDLLQLLNDHVTIWHPTRKKSITANSFVGEWGIDPALWADVKALAGCDGDNVIGIRGVGEKTAVKFLTGNLKPTSKAYQSIVADNGRWRDNLPLVRLPFNGTPRQRLVDDSLSEECWRKVMDDLGMSTLRSRGRCR